MSNRTTIKRLGRFVEKLARDEKEQKKETSKAFMSEIRFIEERLGLKYVGKLASPKLKEDAKRSIRLLSRNLNNIESRLDNDDDDVKLLNIIRAFNKEIYENL